MSEPKPETPAAAPSSPPSPTSVPAHETLGGATYDVLRQRLQAHAAVLRERVEKLDQRRAEVFGSIESKILHADRVTTAHNCIPRDMARIGTDRFLFGFNVHFGLKKEIELGDVFAIYQRDPAAGFFKEQPLDPLSDPRFVREFKRLYHVYEKAHLRKFSVIEGRLYMVFQTGATFTDVAVFKWELRDDGLAFLDARAEAEFKRVGFPETHPFRWRTPDRQSFRYGDHPHVSIEDRVFVECIGGDLTIKVEDNTATGEGLYSEPVEDRHQKVDDAEIGYAILGHLVLLRVRPYKEKEYRHFIYNAKVQQVTRVDALGDSCALLPEDHGLMLPDGYYLRSGEYKQFESRERGHVLERVLHAPNGEDSLFVFYHVHDGSYVLLPYRLIPQKVEERLACHGFSIFPNGHLLVFRADPEPQKHHQVQLRQTPFHEKGHEPPGQRDAFLYRVGNKDVVRCLAEANEILSLASRDEPYAELYADLVRRTDATVDAHPWTRGEEGAGLAEALGAIRETADLAVAEFDKVRRQRREAARRVTEARTRAKEETGALRRANFRTLDEYVQHLGALRRLRGDLIGLKEVRYIDVPAIEALETEVVGQTDELAGRCAKFLLDPAALEPYRVRAAEHGAHLESIQRAAEGRRREEQLAGLGTDLEMLIEIVNGLRIADAAETTRIIDAITAIYSTLNQARTALRKHVAQLAATEGAAQFAAQLKLLGQAASSYLDLADSPAKCDEYLNRLGVQIEEIEGRFAEFEGFAVQIADRRTELHEAFEQRKLALVEQRNRRTQGLLESAERLLRVVRNRLAACPTPEEIQAYLASDAMAAKVRDTVAQLRSLGDAVKADDLEGRLKSARQDALRQLRDRQELSGGGMDVVQLGRHRFSINTQPLDLTIVFQDGQPQVHLTGTKYFEPVTDEAFLAQREVWDLESVAETPEVYRAEYLADELLGDAIERRVPAADLVGFVQERMGTRYQEGYAKGIHDADAARILEALLETHLALEHARIPPAARALAVVFWERFCPADARARWTTKLGAFSERNRLFPGEPSQAEYTGALRVMIEAFATDTRLYPPDLAPSAAGYLFDELVGGAGFVLSREAGASVTAFERHLASKGADATFARAREALAGDPTGELQLVRDWVRGFLLARPEERPFLEEIAARVFCGEGPNRRVVDVATTRMLAGLKGAHPRVTPDGYRFDYFEFRRRLAEHRERVVPRFEAYRKVKQAVLQRERERLRLDEFRPRVLTSFVRNQLIDRVYLPLVGDNLAKQIGATGDAKRTDLMGLLLLVSPPGYGKTTLMEYIASRLGIVFVKVNGPALGHGVTSLDPEDAPNAAARQEIHRLNLAFEMGDNVMLCLDDIQHTNPEFLQKFISLCDGQRKIEGVWKGRPRTYDLRGRKVVVVMAGNPYTESGQRFKLPDMLANRADTYNLGDILGGHADEFRSSYLENALTSNPVLAPLATRDPKDVRAFLRVAEGRADALEGLEGQYSAQESEEILGILRKLVALRETVLLVNQEYIRSAGQADEFRVEPPFRLQGSYRNMNRLAEKVVPIMNQEELDRLIVDHYTQEAQTLTTGAEANLLKFKQLTGRLKPEEAARWDDIQRTYRRNQLTRGADANDAVGRLVTQLAAFHAGLESIRDTLAEARKDRPRDVVVDLSPVAATLEALRQDFARNLAEPRPSASLPAAPAPALDLAPLAGTLDSLRRDLVQRLDAARAGTPPAVDETDRIASLTHELEMIHSTLATLKDLAAQQRDHLRSAQELLAARAKQGTLEFEVTQDMLQNEEAFLARFHQVLAAKDRPPEPPPGG